MGCNGSKEPPQRSIIEAPKQKGGGGEPRAFGRRLDLDPKDFRVQGLEGKAVIRRPGEVAGQVFDVDGCVDCDIWLFDHTEQIQIDNCKRCRFFIGACCASIFIRDCSDCDLEVGCKQFRTRDCKNVRVLLFASTRPVIETSSNFQFGCFRGSYFNHSLHLETARLSVWNNTWGEVHDFTRGAAPRANWKPVPWDVECAGLLPAFPEEVIADVGTMEDQVTVPVTYFGRDLVGTDNPAFILFQLDSERDVMSLVEHFKVPYKGRAPCTVKSEDIVSLGAKGPVAAPAPATAGAPGPDLAPTGVTTVAAGADSGGGDEGAAAGAASEEKRPDKDLPPPCAPETEPTWRRKKKRAEALPIVLLRTRAQILSKGQIEELVPKSSKAFRSECIKTGGRVVGLQYSGERALADVSAWVERKALAPTVCWFAGPDSRAAANKYFLDFAPKV